METLVSKAFLKRSAFILVGSLVLLFAAAFLLILYRSSIMEEKQERVRNMVESVHELVDFYYDKVENSGMSEEDAKQYAFQAIRDLPYDVNGYTWINDINGIMVMHPSMPHLNGTSVLDWKDSKGKYLFREFIKTVQTQGAGFVDYMWPKPHESKDKEYPKISYVKLFKPWGWIIGSGIYIDDVNTAFWHAVMVFSSIMAGLLVFVATLILTLSEGFKKL